MVGKRVAEWDIGYGALLALALELRALVHGRARDPHRPGERRADKERDPPAPTVEVGVAHQVDGQCRDANREQAADFAGRRSRRSDQPASPYRRAFEEICDVVDIFATDREPHYAAQ